MNASQFRGFVYASGTDFGNWKSVRGFGSRTGTDEGDSDRIDAKGTGGMKEQRAVQLRLRRFDDRDRFL